MDNDIFKFIKSYDNDYLSKMNGFDLYDLVNLLNDYYLQLRNKIGIEDDITFGFEIEFEKVKNRNIDYFVEKMALNDTWNVKNDNSLVRGKEINSPVLVDKQRNWEDLDRICSFIEKYGKIGKNSSGHIHIGIPILGDNKEAWLNFIKIWAVYENIIFRFLYGEYLTARPKILKYASPVADIFWDDYENLIKEKASLNAIVSRISHKRAQAVNLSNIRKGNYKDNYIKNTIEFRCPNGSMDPVIYQNNSFLIISLLKYCKSSYFDDDLIQKRYELNSDIFSNLALYNEIYLEQALELCDMIYSNNFDKIYFLKQYLKSFQVSRNINIFSMDKAKVFTKKGMVQIP